MTKGMHMHSLAWTEYAFADVLYQYNPTCYERDMSVESWAMLQNWC